MFTFGSFVTDDNITFLRAHHRDRSRSDPEISLRRNGLKYPSLRFLRIHLLVLWRCFFAIGQRDITTDVLPPAHHPAQFVLRAP